MVTQTQSPSRPLAALIKDPLPLSPSLFIKKIQEDGRRGFETFGIPTTRDEEWKYTNLDFLTKRKFTLTQGIDSQKRAEFKPLIDESDITITFVNGIFSPSLSEMSSLPKGLDILPLSKWLSQSTEILQTYLTHKDFQNTDAFVSLNSSFLRDGAFIKIEPKAVIPKLIHIVHITTVDKDDVMTLPRSLIIVGESAQAEILESHISTAAHFYFSNALTDILVNQNANLKYYKAQSEGPKAYHIGTTRVLQGQGSQFESFSFSIGAKLTRNNLNIFLNGEGSSAVLNGLYAVSDSQHVDNHTSVDHRPPRCVSNQLYKGILDGSATAAFNGKIFVRRIAQQTNSYQLNKNLLLGKGCQVNTKPQLEIFADDVRCTHGATIGQLNEEELFYLESRAIPKNLAVKMLARGFVDDILSKLTNVEIHKRFENLLTKTFSILR